MPQIGKLLMLAGVGLVILGAAIWGLGKAGFRGLPGDIKYQGEHTSFYFPVVTCLVLSLVLTLAGYVWRWLTRGP